MRVRASINIDLDTLSDDIDQRTRIIHSPALRAITYTKVLPRFIELLDRHSLKATFFVIGQDIAGHEDLLRRLANDGHELANHTMNHPKQLVNLTPAAMAFEIEECGARLAALAGCPIVGFRAPGYTLSPAVVAILRRAGYTYDTSLNASLVYAAVKRAFQAVKLTDQEYVVCQPIRDLFGPRNPYRLSADRLAVRDESMAFLEIPVSIIPYVQYPFITSVLLRFGLAPTLWALDRLVASGRFVNCGLHINEFTDWADVTGVDHGFYYTRQLMQVPLDRRLQYYDGLLGAIRRKCEVVLLRDVVA